MPFNKVDVATDGTLEAPMPLKLGSFGFGVLAGMFVSIRNVGYGKKVGATIGEGEILFDGICMDGFLVVADDMEGIRDMGFLLGTIKIGDLFVGAIDTI